MFTNHYLQSKHQLPVDPGDEVLVAEPMYVTYEAVFGACGAKVMPVPVKPDATAAVKDSLDEREQVVAAGAVPAPADPAPVVAAALFVVTRLFWLRAVGSYTSASS